MTLRHRLVACLLLIVALPAAAQDFQEALDLHAAGDHGAAYSMMRELAISGHAGAETMLGVMHYHGQGVEADAALAAAWFVKGAMKGNANAQLALGALYMRGQGVGRDPEAACGWLLLAARDLGETADEADRLLAALLPDLTAEQRARAERFAADFRSSAAR